MAMQAQGDWENGLCDHVCGGDCGTCWGAWCCSPCLFGRTSARYDRFPSQDGEATNFCNGGCAIFYLASCFSLAFLPMMLKRGEIRNKFNIHGDGCMDCLLSACCTPCALAQMEMEMKSRAAGGHVASIEVKDPYAAQQGGMVYQAPSEAPAYQQPAQVSNGYQQAGQGPVGYQQTGQVASAGQPAKY